MNSIALKVSESSFLSLLSLMPAYENFISRFQSLPDVGKQADKYIRYGVEDIEAKLTDLFKGSSGLMGRSCDGFFQERIKILDGKMVYYENLAEMYVGDYVSPDFYGWVFPKCDHVAVGTGTVTHNGDIKKFQHATKNRAKDQNTPDYISE